MNSLSPKIRSTTQSSLQTEQQRHYILYDLTDGEGQGDREFSNTNRDSREHPYSASMYLVHDELDEGQVKVMRMRMVRL